MDDYMPPAEEERQPDQDTTMDDYMRPTPDNKEQRQRQHTPSPPPKRTKTEKKPEDTPVSEGDADELIEDEGLPKQTPKPKKPTGQPKC